MVDFLSFHLSSELRSSVCVSFIAIRCFALLVTNMRLFLMFSCKKIGEQNSRFSKCLYVPSVGQCYIMVITNYMYLLIMLLDFLYLIL